MEVGNYTFSCIVVSPMVLPRHKGSVIRGVLGASLKRVSCALRHQHCDTCILRERCIYVSFYERLLPVPGSPKWLNVRPSPFVLEPPDTERQEFNPDTRFSFNILLFGKANESLPYLIYAIERMGRHGLGRALDSGDRGRFTLEAVVHEGQNIYTAKEGRLHQPESLMELVPPDLSRGYPSSAFTKVSARLCTPLRLKSGNKFQDQLPFSSLVRAALRRISSLEATYGEGEPDLPYRELAAMAESVKIADKDLRWQDWHRYSSRQKAPMRLGGIVGTVLYEGEKLGVFMPLLRYVEQVHLGKQTTFGLGRLEIIE